MQIQVAAISLNALKFGSHWTHILAFKLFERDSTYSLGWCLTFHEEPVEICAFPRGMAIIFLRFFGNINSQAHFIQWPRIFSSHSLHDCFGRSRRNRNWKRGDKVIHKVPRSHWSDECLPEACFGPRVRVAALEQGLANSGPHDNFPACVNEVLLERPCLLGFVLSVCFCTILAKWSRHERNHVTLDGKRLLEWTSSPLTWLLLDLLPLRCCLQFYFLCSFCCHSVSLFGHGYRRRTGQQGRQSHS